MRNRAYRATSVKQVAISVLADRLAPGPIVVGVDVGKERALKITKRGPSLARRWL